MQTSGPLALSAEYTLIAHLIVDALKAAKMLGSFLQDTEWKRCYEAARVNLPKGRDAALNAVIRELNIIKPFYFGDK